MKAKRIVTIVLILFTFASQVFANEWESEGQTKNSMPSSGNWTYNYLIKSGTNVTRRVNAVLSGANTNPSGVKEVVLTGDVMLRHSVFVGLSTDDNKPTTLIIKNGTDDEINFWDDLDKPNDGDNFPADNFMVLFSVWEGCTLIIDGDPDRNGKGKIKFGGNANHRGLETKYGFIESTGNLVLKDVIIEHVKFNQANAEGGECSVLKIHPWMEETFGRTYEQGYTKLTNCEIRNITMPGGVGAVMYCYLETQDKPKNTRESCTITMDNVSIHDVSQGSISNDGNGGIIRFRGDWVGNLNMTNVKISNCTSGASSAGVYWNALGRSSAPCEMTLDGCTFQNLKVTGGNAGALLIEGRARFVNNQTKFIGNSCSQFGGGVYIHNYNSTDTPQSGESFTYDINQYAYFEGNSADHGGGLAIYIDDNSTLPSTNFHVNVNGAVFKNNTANAEAGAMKINLGTNSTKYNLYLNLNSGTFEGNSAPNGGAIYSWRGAVSSAADGSCTFTGNTATTSGSAIFVNNSNFTLRNAEFSNNTATNHGGAIYVVNSTMTMDNGYIHDNLSGGYGGGICAIGSSFSMSNGRIEHNTAGLHGGGIYFDNSKGGDSNTGVANRKFSFSGGSISGNTSGGFGGGVCIYTGNKDGCTFELTGGELTGGKINDNTAENGGGVYLNGWAKYTMQLTDTNVENNTAYLGGGVLIYNAHLNYKNGLIRYNRAIKREGNTAPTTMYLVNHCLWDSGKSEDYVNTTLSGIGGGVYSNWGKTVFDTSDGKFGIYSNLAEFGADDIFTNAKDTEINLPDPTKMTVVGFDVPAANQYWAQDYIERDTNYNKKPASTYTFSQNRRFRSMLNDLDANLAQMKVPSGTYKDYICVTLGYNFAPVKIIKKGLYAGETAIINFYHKVVGDGNTEEPYMQMVILNDTGVDGAEITKKVNLRPGTWTLVESNWSWSYSGGAEGPGNRIIDGQAAIVRENLLDTSDEEQRTFIFTNHKTTTTTPAKESIKTNVMTP